MAISFVLGCKVKTKTKKLIGDTLFVMLCITAMWMAPVAVIEIKTSWQEKAVDKAEMRRAEQAMYSIHGVLQSAASWPLSEEEWRDRFLEVTILGDQARALRDRIRDGGHALRDANGHPYEADEIDSRLRAVEETVRRKGYSVRHSP